MLKAGSPTDRKQVVYAVVSSTEIAQTKRLIEAIDAARLHQHP